MRLTRIGTCQYKRINNIPAYQVNVRFENNHERRELNIAPFFFCKNMIKYSCKKITIVIISMPDRKIVGVDLEHRRPWRYVE